MSMNTPTYRDEKLGAALRALETPDHGLRFGADLRRRLAEERPVAGDMRVLRRFRPSRLSRRRSVAVAAVMAAAVAVPAVVLGVQALGSESTPPDWSAAVGDLPALAPGPPRTQGGSASIAHVSPEELVSRAANVFVGTVVAEGGSEFADPVFEDPDYVRMRMTVHRVRFSVERTLRGEAVPALDLTIPDLGPDIDVFEVGDRLLVFASPVEFGELRVPGLTPMGYFQGVFRMGADGTARNEGSGVTFTIDELESELERP